MSETQKEYKNTDEELSNAAIVGKAAMILGLPLKDAIRIASKMFNVVPGTTKVCIQEIDFALPKLKIGRGSMKDFNAKIRKMFSGE